MKKLFVAWAVALCMISHNSWSQTEKSTPEAFYATILSEDAKTLSKLFPDKITIYSSADGESAVYMHKEAAEYLHHNVLTHGPGYIFMPTLKKAEASILRKSKIKNAQAIAQAAVTYTIDQDDFVNQSLDLVDNFEIESTILDLVDYGSRYHTYSSAAQSVQDIATKWQSYAAGRSDVSVRLVDHYYTNMPSAIITIQGTTYPDEYVIIGGHIDSINPRGNSNAPGADDDASGIATITEALRVLMEMDFKPQRTIEIMAYAAEEVGLVGSAEIAEDYKDRNVNVIAYTQFDMTNYKGSSNDIYFVNDSYTTPQLTSFLMELVDHYNASGTHAITYGTSQCNYGCSDHASWEGEGYNAAFPIEATFNDSNPYIHSSSDTYDKAPVPNSLHAAKFTKLALEFLIEVAKGSDGDAPSCGTPTNLSASNITTSAAGLSWSNASQAASYTYRYKVASSGNWISGTSTTNSRTITGLAEDTSYDFQVRSNCQDENSNYSSTYTFRTLSSQPVEYCDAAGNSTNYEYIRSISVGATNNTSNNDGGYGDYTSTVISLNPGSSYAVSLTPGFAGSSYSESWAIWIDFNQDGDFTDSNEQIYSTTSSSAVSGTISIPSSVSVASTRMRIAMRYNNSPSSCGTFNYGEVEDYTVVFSSNATNAKVAHQENKLKDELVVFPNPSSTGKITLTINESQLTENAKAEILSIDGKTIKTIAIKDVKTEIDINALPKGTFILLLEAGQQKKSQTFIKE